MALDQIDNDLLAAAKTAGALLADAERGVDRARADYHHAVRRLHLAGAPLRDVAHALGMSHQRVQQIVKAGGGTWWSRVWRSRRVRPDMNCSFCGLPSEQVAKLIAGPKCYICDVCVAAAERGLAGGRSESGAPRLTRVPPTSGVRCSFCSKKSGSDLAIVASGDHRVCERCVTLCREILNDGTQAPQPPA